MRTIALVLLCSFGLIAGRCNYAAAQDSSSIRYHHHVVYLELFGQGLMYSLNYEYQFNEHFSLRAGASTWTFRFFATKLKFTAFPVMANYLTGNNGNYLETGVGFLPAFIEYRSGETLFSFEDQHAEQSNGIIGTATIGYRLQPPDERYLMRIGMTPLFTTRKIVFYGGISGGFRF